MRYTVILPFLGTSKVELMQPLPDTASVCSHLAPCWVVHGYKPTAIMLQILVAPIVYQTGEEPESPPIN